MIPIKIIKRIGLRYIDYAPIPALDIETFEKWYNTAFPLNRFNLDKVGSMYFEVRNVKSGNYQFNYRERFSPERGEDLEKSQMKYYLDFDGYAGDIPSENYLDVLDGLHGLIHYEWENNTIKQPVKDWMDRDKKGGENV